MIQGMRDDERKAQRQEGRREERDGDRHDKAFALKAKRGQQTKTLDQNQRRIIE